MDAVYMKEFVDLLDFIVSENSSNTSDSGSENSSPKCNGTVDHYLFYQLTLIPAFVISFSFALTQRRRNIFLNFLSGRPGLIYPMDSLTRSSRISYACAFGATAELVYNIVIEKTTAIDYKDIAAVKSFVAMASMFIFGMTFYPVFASLALESVFGYSIGALYVWMLTGVFVYRLFECEESAFATLITVLDQLPTLLCLSYLSVSIPVRACLQLRKNHFPVWASEFKNDSSVDRIKRSYAGLYVAQLFQKPVVPRTPEGRPAKCLALLKELIERWVYRPQKGFRYPARILAVKLVGIMVVYSLSFEIILEIIALADYLKQIVDMFITNKYGMDAILNEQETITNIRNFLISISDFIYASKVCGLLAVALAVVLTIVNILHMLSSYRSNLHALYKGDHSTLPPASAGTNISHCINSIKFAGFQVAYIIWGYVLQIILLSSILITLAFIIIFLLDFSEIILIAVNRLWPLVVTIIFVLVVQFLLAKFVFLQERGGVLALDNRHCYFNFSYFMFFYNIFLGLFSCLLRIVKAAVVGVLFSCRLDYSALPRKFEFLDPGFKAYTGFMQIEYAHTHPVVKVFVQLMLLGNQEVKRRNMCQCKLLIKELEENGVTGHVETRIEVEKRERGSAQMRSRAAVFQWHVTYTLLHNPSLRIYRKGYVQMLRQARDLGLVIPISDRQADVDVTQLVEIIKEKRKDISEEDEQGK